MRVLANISPMLQFVWSSGRNALLAAFRRQTCGFAFITQVSGVSLKRWQIHRKGRNA